MAGWGRKSGMVLAQSRGSGFTKTKNSGNEAKKYLKTKNITFLSDANYAHFACKLTPIGRHKEQKTPRFAKTN